MHPLSRATGVPIRALASGYAHGHTHIHARTHAHAHTQAQACTHIHTQAHVSHGVLIKMLH